MTETHFDAIVVGSGFGGSVSAYRLAEAGLRVCLLERGKAYPPGAFARSPLEMKQNFWDPSKGLHGMFNIWSFRGLDAVVSSGLGGGSLIYANVLIRKDGKWFVREDLRRGGYEYWPITREDLEPHYDQVEQMLNAQRYPFEHSPYNNTHKTRAFKAAADQLRLDWQLPKLAVTFANNGQNPVPGEPIEEAYPNLHGKARQTCRLCGECDIGCNHGSKNTLDYNYLTEAQRLGAELRTGCEVKGLQPLPGGGYAISYIEHHPEAGGKKTDKSRPAQVRITADRLVLAAGSLGSTYLLLRNRAYFPGLSRQLGSRFCGNGDLLTFALKCRQLMDPSGAPVITSAIRVPDALDGGQGRGFYLEDAGYPEFLNWIVEMAGLGGAIVRSLKFSGRYVSSLLGINRDTDIGAELSDLMGPAAFSSTSLPLLGMGRDIPDGQMQLRGKHLDVDWTRHESADFFDRLADTAQDVVHAMNGQFRRNPLSYLKRLITVHPLGGCPMGRNPMEGVVDPYGEAFGHPGLFIVDGAAMPGPVGPNPSLTIAAVANRCAEKMVLKKTPKGSSIPIVIEEPMTEPMSDRVYEVKTHQIGTLRTTLHRLTTQDGVNISLSHLAHPGAKDSVLLIHGLTTSSDMFVMPEHDCLAAFLHDHGFDVWLADFRMSNHYAYNYSAKVKFNFEDIALHDWPTIVNFIQEAIRGNRLHVICHCLGSVTFHAALYGKTVSGITSVISNSVSLNPKVRLWSLIKILVAPFLIDRVLKLDFIDPKWAERNAPGQPWLGRMLAKLIGYVHLECNEHACNLLSFTWGTGFPAMFVHQNMDPITHDRFTELFGPVAMQYFRNVRKGLLSKNTFVKYDGRPEYDSLPDRYFDNVGDIAVPTLFISGDCNNIFPGANRITAERIKAKGIGGYEYLEVPGYGHQDIFMGNNCAAEVFPLFLPFLRRHQQASQPPAPKENASVSFTEEMKGFFTEGETSYTRGAERGEDNNTNIMFHLTITIDDLDAISKNPGQDAEAVGYIESEALGGRMEVQMGRFNLFVDDPERDEKRMLYRLFFSDPNGRQLTLSGFKVIRDDPGFDLWSDTTTLYTQIFEGHVEAKDEESLEPVAKGIIYINMLDFLKQLTTFQAEAPTAAERLEALQKFGKLFLGELWEAYNSRIPMF
ncbi:Glucose-methanol-choline (GMC) oxidoreductase:NAD binding site [Olavius sp. associated proteobacterium Delta 1]|nr:Glucose-methanol-choline (GMC) oxidoreductase:NAD binding site [Olavius sp. associated proteobacterium Delta 1]